MAWWPTRITSYNVCYTKLLRLLKYLSRLHVERSVDHETERALGVVLAQIGDRAVEIRVSERRHRNQEVMSERAHCFGAAYGRCASVA